MTRAYRRPVEAEELHARSRPFDASYEEALIDNLWCYSSPDPCRTFPVDAETLEPRKLNGYEIASRLSYRAVCRIHNF